MCLCDDESESCKGSSRPGQPSGSCPCTRPPTTSSPFLVISSLLASTASSEPRRSGRGGTRPVLPLNMDQWAAHRARLQQRDMCGRPFRSKRNLQERCSAWSGADMCSAFAAARSMPRARMGVRGSGPTQSRALEARCHVLVFPIPSLDRCAIPLLRPSHPSTASRSWWRLGRHDRSSIHLTLGQQSPDDPGHLVGQRDPHQHRRLAGQHAPKP